MEDKLLLNKLHFIRNIQETGEDRIIIKAIEEMSELSQVLCKCLGGDERHPHIAEELTDVEIMLEQLHIIFEGRHEDFETECEVARRYKLDRQKKRISKLSQMRKADEQSHEEHSLLHEL